jgi:uncharacterized membrane protein (DUF106 family)
MINILEIVKNNLLLFSFLIINILIAVYFTIFSYSLKKLYFYNEEKFNFLKKEIKILESKLKKRKNRKNRKNKNPNLIMI